MNLSPSVRAIRALSLLLSVSMANSRDLPVQHEGSQGVDHKDLCKLWSRDLIHFEQPAVLGAQVNLMASMGSLQG
jgi:hypothetical protein